MNIWLKNNKASKDYNKLPTDIHNSKEFKQNKSMYLQIESKMLYLPKVFIKYEH